MKIQAKSILHWMKAGVISREGLRGGAPLLKFAITLGGLAPQKFMHWPCFSKFVDLASKVFSIVMISYALLRGY